MSAGSSPVVRMEFQATLDSLKELNSAFASFCEATGIKEPNRYKLDTALDELATNIIKYAYPDTSAGKYEVLFCLTETGCCRIEFRDHGIPFDPTSRPDPDTRAALHDRPVGGLGIFLARQFMDCMEYSRQDGYNILRIEKKMGGEE